MPPSVDAIRAEATRIGFVACGIASLEPSRRGDALDRWLAAGFAGTMRYLHRQARKRKTPAEATRGARTAIVVLENYAAPGDEGPESGDAFKVAAFARGTDYHVVTLARLLVLAEWLRANGAGLAHAWVDHAPIPERELAERAGLGWIGKNTMLIHPLHGSLTFIGSVFTDLDLATLGAARDGALRLVHPVPRRLSDAGLCRADGARCDPVPLLPHDRVQAGSARQPPPPV